MRDEEIEILEDFSNNNDQMNNAQINPSTIQTEPFNNPIPDYNINTTTNYNNNQNIAQTNQANVIQENNSVSDFEKMVNEVNNPESEPVIENANNMDYSNNYNNQNNNFNDLNYNVNDTNNELVQQSNSEDLTITAIYPNGFVVPEQEEQEDNRVVKPKKQKGDLYLIIIVAVLAITLAVMLVIFYL